MRIDKYTPLVGILTSPGKKPNTFRGDFSVFKSIQKELMSIGGLSFIFTPDGVHHDCISGYVYVDHEDKWGKITFPYPDLIYNKVSSRKDEQTPSFLALYELYQQKRKPFFNSRFFNKWDTYCTLIKSEQLLPYVPETDLFTNTNDLLKKLTINQPLYIKPIDGHKGKGIYKLSYDGKYYYLQRKQKKIKYFLSDFVHMLDQLLHKQPYLMQNEIQTDTMDECKYDLRVLCLYEDGEHTISGIGVREAAKDSIITHVPNGGEIDSFQRIKERYSISQINWLTKAIGHQLTTRYGFIGEFSIDIGLSKDGNPVIFEVNSKPMVFDEPHIQEKRISQLTHLFCKLTNSSNAIEKEF